MKWQLELDRSIQKLMEILGLISIIINDLQETISDLKSIEEGVKA